MVGWLVGRGVERKTARPVELWYPAELPTYLPTYLLITLVWARPRTETRLSPIPIYILPAPQGPP